MAREFCRVGAQVLVCGRTEETLQATVDAVAQEIGPDRAHLAICDVRDPESVAAMVTAAETAMGGVDGLVNNASGLFPVHAEDLTPNGFRAVVDIVLNGSFHCTSEVARRWLASDRPGAVINILTPSAWMGAPGFSHNGAAKGGVLNLTRTLGVEWADRRVRVNAVAPGWMQVGGPASSPCEGAVRVRPRAALQV